MQDFVTQLRRTIDDRLDELKPFAEEYKALERELADLGQRLEPPAAPCGRDIGRVRFPLAR